MANELTVDELEQFGINKHALASFDDAAKEAAIQAGIDEAYDYIRSVIAVPLVNPNAAVKTHMGRIAVFHLMSTRGMDAERDRLIVDNYERAIRFFTYVAKGVVTIGGAEPPPEGSVVGPGEIGDPEVFSNELRGF